MKLVKQVQLGQLGVRVVMNCFVVVRRLGMCGHSKQFLCVVCIKCSSDFTECFENGHVFNTQNVMQFYEDFFLRVLVFCFSVSCWLFQLFISYFQFVHCICLVWLMCLRRCIRLLKGDRIRHVTRPFYAYEKLC